MVKLHKTRFTTPKPGEHGEFVVVDGEEKRAHSLPYCLRRGKDTSTPMACACFEIGGPRASFECTPFGKSGNGFVFVYNTFHTGLPSNTMAEMLAYTLDNFPRDFIPSAAHIGFHGKVVIGKFGRNTHKLEGLKPAEVDALIKTANRLKENYKEAYSAFTTDPFHGYFKNGFVNLVDACTLRTLFGFARFDQHVFMGLFDYIDSVPIDASDPIEEKVKHWVNSDSPPRLSEYGGYKFAEHPDSERMNVCATRLAHGLGMPKDEYMHGVNVAVGSSHNGVFSKLTPTQFLLLQRKIDEIDEDCDED